MTNGHIADGATARPSGRTAKPLPTFTTSAGYELRVRRVAPETLQRIRIQAQRDIPDPEPPLQRVQTPDGEQDVPNPDHPDHVAARKAKDAERNELVGQRLQTFLETYALEYDIDTEAVDLHRRAMNAIGTPLPPDEVSDRYIHLWVLAVPSQQEKNRLMSYVFQLNTVDPEAVREHAATF